jgi:hypothetical protein
MAAWQAWAGCCQDGWGGGRLGRAGHPADRVLGSAPGQVGVAGPVGGQAEPGAPLGAMGTAGAAQPCFAGPAVPGRLVQHVLHVLGADCRLKR